MRLFAVLVILGCHTVASQKIASEDQLDFWKDYGTWLKSAKVQGQGTDESSPDANVELARLETKELAPLVGVMMIRNMDDTIPEDIANGYQDVHETVVKLESERKKTFEKLKFSTDKPVEGKNPEWEDFIDRQRNYGTMAEYAAGAFGFKNRSLSKILLTSGQYLATQTGPIPQAINDNLKNIPTISSSTGKYARIPFSLHLADLVEEAEPNMPSIPKRLRENAAIWQKNLKSETWDTDEITGSDLFFNCVYVPPPKSKYTVIEDADSDRNTAVPVADILQQFDAHLGGRTFYLNTYYDYKNILVNLVGMAIDWLKQFFTLRGYMGRIEEHIRTDFLKIWNVLDKANPNFRGFMENKDMEPYMRKTGMSVIIEELGFKWLSRAPTKLYQTLIEMNMRNVQEGHP